MKEHESERIPGRCLIPVPVVSGVDCLLVESGAWDSGKKAQAVPCWAQSCSIAASHKPQAGGENRRDKLTREPGQEFRKMLIQGRTLESYHFVEKDETGADVGSGSPFHGQ
jgi:hypothetical protein